MTELIKILLIEDDTVDRMFFKRALKDTGINAELIIAEDANEGVSHLLDKDFNCVFLDYMLPGTNGLDLLEKLHSENEGVPIVLITSHGDEKIAVNAMKAGALDYIPKNLITPLSLAQIIRNIIRLKEVEKQKINAEHILKQSEKRHRIFFENSQIFLCTHDLQGNFLTVNYAGAKSLGYTPKELVGTSLKQIVYPSHENLFNEYLKDILNKKTAMGLMYVGTRSGEERIWMYHNYLYEESAHEAYVIGSIQDITERVKMEEEMRQAKVLAEESVKTKEQFLANMSHEIRTPMSAIIGFTNLVLETELNETQAEYIDTINYSAKNLLNIVNDILDFSKIKSGKLFLEEVNFDLSRCISSMVKMFQLEADKKNIELVCTIDPAVPIHFVGDTVRLNQILMNLFSNAIKFTEKGHIQLNVKLLEKKEGSNIIEFSVKDTGIGIPRDKLETVFESFTQAYNDTTRKYGGTGLGLAIIKDLVELYGGQIIAINNTDGPGTTFVFTLLLKDGSVNSQNKDCNEQKKQQEKEQNLAGIRVLIAEDNKIMQRLTTVVLAKMGCEMDIAQNGKEAIEKLENAEYDIVLMDIQMPIMDGYETTRHIRTQLGVKTNKIPIIAMTAHALSDEGAKCILAGMNDYISKPFEKEVLYKKIHDLLIEKKILPDRLPAENSAFQVKSETEKNVLDLSYLKNILGNNNESLLDVLDMLYKEFPIMTENIKVSGINKDWKQLEQDAHKMKSAAMMVNKPDLMLILESIEKYAGNENHFELLPELAKQATFLNYLVIAQLKTELDKLQLKVTR